VKISLFDGPALQLLYLSGDFLARQLGGVHGSYLFSVLVSVFGGASFRGAIASFQNHLA
jgi:hypothetical protein